MLHFILIAIFVHTMMPSMMPSTMPRISILIFYGEYHIMSMEECWTHGHEVVGLNLTIGIVLWP